MVKMRKDVKTRVTPRRERRYKAKLWCGALGDLPTLVQRRARVVHIT